MLPRCWQVVDIYDYHPCTPVGNVIEDNTFCHDGSKGGGQFLDRTEATINSWLSSSSNNAPSCAGGRHALVGAEKVSAAVARRLKSRAA